MARLPEVLQTLSGYPDGLPLAELAALVSVGEETLREDLTAYLDTESWGWGVDIFRPPVLEFVWGEDEDRDDATVVRMLGGSAGLGIEHVDAGELALVYTAGLALLDVEPDNEALVAALEVVASTTTGEGSAVPTPAGWNRFVAPLQQAQESRRRVRIVYSRAWHEGVGVRVVDPLRLVQTKRGWELDAGPVADDDSLRTYLVSNMREVEVLAETFEPPADVAALLERQRRTTTVRMELGQDARWAADMYAEKVHVVPGAESEETFQADLEMLPPVDRRVGLLMLASGQASRVLTTGAEVLPGAVALVAELLEHYERPVQG
ncbi:WYL domain-containing protein [Nocardioides sp. 1609]|uniref:helix-turn-helix transcriptional regulator n=1 Tax=Nocardioides sp. 1609 TaxID=2508327 RepID=UPI001430DF25|nr:WYL domain-containing protein [Nocardioides sp. 1609]